MSADKYREEISKVLEVHQTEWIGHEEGWDCGCNERGYLPAMPSMLDAQNHQAGEVVKVLERALAEQRDAIADAIEKRWDHYDALYYQTYDQHYSGVADGLDLGEQIAREYGKEES